MVDGATYSPCMHALVAEIFIVLTSDCHAQNVNFLWKIPFGVQ